MIKEREDSRQGSRDDHSLPSFELSYSGSQPGRFLSSDDRELILSAPNPSQAMQIAQMVYMAVEEECPERIRSYVMHFVQKEIDELLR